MLTSPNGELHAGFAAAAQVASDALGDDPRTAISDLVGRALELVSMSPDGAVVRFGSAGELALIDYLPSRIVEFVCHGIDLCEAIDRETSDVPLDALAVSAELLAAYADPLANVKLLVGRNGSPYSVFERWVPWGRSINPSYDELLGDVVVSKARKQSSEDRRTGGITIVSLTIVCVLTNAISLQFDDEARVTIFFREFRLRQNTHLPNNRKHASWTIDERDSTVITRMLLRAEVLLRKLCVYLGSAGTRRDTPVSDCSRR